MKQNKFGKFVVSAVIAGCALGAGVAQAQVQRGFIGAHEYALPDPAGMEPWNVFVEYTTFQKTKKVWNGSGDRTEAGDVETLVSLSKFVHFWEIAPDVGIAMELIVPKVSVNDRENGGGVSGIGDALVGPAFWIKPSANWTLGADMGFLQVPIGDRELRGTRWNFVASVFWDGQFDKFNWTGNVAATFLGPTEDDGAPDPANPYAFTNRFGYRATDLLEPYVGLDYAWQNSKGDAPSAHEWVGAVGVMFHLAPTYHFAVHYQGGIEGENMPVSNNLNLRFAYVF